MSNRHWAEIEAIRHVLDNQGYEPDCRPPVHSFDQLLGGFPEKSGVRLRDLSTNFSHTQLNRVCDKNVGRLDKWFCLSYNLNAY